MKTILVPYDKNTTKEELLKAIADAVGSDVETVKKELYEPKDKPQTCEDCKHNGEKHAYDYACDKCTDMDKFQHEDES